MNATHCQMCEAHDIDTPATTVVDAAEAIARGFDWSIEDALAAGYSRREPMCAECVAQLPVVPRVVEAQ